MKNKSIGRRPRHRRWLALTLVVSLLAVSAGGAFAGELTDITDNPYRESIEHMVDLGVLQGRGGGLFAPLDHLTRAEAAKVAAYLAGFSEQDAHAARSDEPVFRDVTLGMGAHEWAVGWINLVAREGIIQGYGDGLYGPGDNLQMVQWAAILLRIMGHEDEGMAWPAGYDEKAASLGLTENLPYQRGALVNRGEMARFTSTAVRDVARADGSFIEETLLELQREREERRAEGPEAIVLSVSLGRPSVPAGGNQAMTIQATVRDLSGQPVEGAQVSFHAEAFEKGERHHQLSPREAWTDASGVARSVYTTLAQDDGQFITVQVAASAGDAMEFGRASFVAANQTARVRGVVRDPRTGAVLPQVPVHFMPYTEGGSGPNRSIGFVETDAAGRYEMTVPVSRYVLTLELQPRDSISVDLRTAGAQVVRDYSKGVLTGVIRGAPAGAEVFAIGTGFRSTDPTNHTLLTPLASDGSFTLRLFPGTYELNTRRPDGSYYVRGVVVQSHRINDIGTIQR